MTDFHDIIFVTDKYGRRNKTGDIEKLAYDSRKNVYYITYKDGKTYPCRSCDIQIIKNCLKDKQSASVFDYLIQMAQFNELKNDEGQNLLVKNLEKSRFINEHSVLSRYLNPKKGKTEKFKISSLIFPFGCNNSQFKAVSNALNNQVSIIQGPPGTGLKRIREVCAENGIEEPVYKSTSAFFVATVKRKSYAKKNALKKKLNERLNLSDKEQKILSIIKEKGQISSKEIIETTGFSHATVEKAAKRLSEELLLIRREGSKKTDYWKINTEE